MLLCPSPQNPLDHPRIASNDCIAESIFTDSAKLGNQRRPAKTLSSRLERSTAHPAQETDMQRVLSGPEQLRNLFAALTEQTFAIDLGVADPPLVDYLSDMLVRFVRIEAIFSIRDVVGRRLEEVADMLCEAGQREGRPRRELHRHIGDFTLFWTGVYPEALRRLRTPERKDALLDYQVQGKRSYFIASTFDADEYRAEAPVLRRLSEEFELYSQGLARVRREWERLPQSADWSADQN
jgi:hypothetical protein